jgi:hypothetical protein
MITSTLVKFQQRYVKSHTVFLQVPVIGQWRYSLMADKLTATMQIAKQVYSLAQEQNDAALMTGAYRALAITLFYLGDFEAARQHAIRGVRIWRSGGVQSHSADIDMAVVGCLCHEAVCEWCLGEPVIKGLARVTALAKPCSLFGTLASSALGCKRQRRGSIARIGIL